MIYQKVTVIKYWWTLSISGIMVLKVLFVLIGLNLKVLYTDLSDRWNLHCQIGLDEKYKSIIRAFLKLRFSQAMVFPGNALVCFLKVGNNFSSNRK